MIYLYLYMSAPLHKQVLQLHKQVLQLHKQVLQLHKCRVICNGRQQAPFHALFCERPLVAILCTTEGSSVFTEMEDCEHELEDGLDMNSWPLHVIPVNSSVGNGRTLSMADAEACLRIVNAYFIVMWVVPLLVVV